MAVRDFLLPDLGEGLEDAEIISWKVAEGDHVELNQPLADLNTAKAVVEIPSPWEGVVRTLHGAEGDVVMVGAPLVSIEVGAEGTNAPAPPEAKPKRQAVLVGYGVEEEEPPGEPQARDPAAPSARANAAGGGRVRATPPVRRLAKELGIDLASVEGTGPNGRVTREDVVRRSPEEAEEAPAPLRAVPTIVAGRRIPVRGTRRLIAERMTRSAREIPHVTVFNTVDCHWLQLFREELARDEGQKVSPLPIVVRALIELCRLHPLLNSTFAPEEPAIVLHDRIHVGVATDTEQGLVVPVVHGAEEMGILELHREIGRLAEAARAGRSKPEDMVGSTITVSNVGSFGSQSGTPIINHPEAAILALGVIEPRALVVDGKVEPRPATTLSLSFDHRVMDGAEAGRALKALGDLLESPFKLGSLPR